MTEESSGLEIRWPDEMTEQVIASKGRLERAGAALRAMSLEERLDGVARVLSDWTGADSAWRRELTATFAEESGFHEETVREGLDAALRAWRPDDLVACVRRELGLDSASDGRAIAPFPWTAVLAGGGLPMPTLLSGLLPLILGSPVLLREASGDHVTAGLLKRSIEARSEGLARAFESIRFPSEDPAMEEFLSAPCVVATGSDETIRSIKARVRPSQRLVAYTHQFSIGVMGSEIPCEGDSLRQLAEGFALDMARWDQTGCLSPVVVYLVGLEVATRRDMAIAIGDALERLHGRMPRGEVPLERSASQANEIAAARMRSEESGSMLIEGRDSTVVLEVDAQPRPAPLYRFVRLMPVDSLDNLRKALAPFAGHLSNVASVGFSANGTRELSGLLSDLGVSRVTSPGRLQTPPIDWPHDGMPLLTPMARFIHSEPGATAGKAP